MSNKILFIINPISGHGSGKMLTPILEKELDGSDIEYEIKYTERGKHIPELIQNAVKDNYYAVVVAGGDGTVHEAIEALVHAKTILGVIPCGSGNGFANHFKIPRDPVLAIQLILKNYSTQIDTINVNGNHCAATAGIGFDAHIAFLFSKLKSRGFFNYVRLSIQEIFSYKSKSYSLEFQNQKITRKAFTITFANTSEYGNSAVIAPQANASDGKMDVCILKNIHPFSFPMLGIRLFTRSINSSSNYESYACDRITLRSDTPEKYHMDGEPMDATNLLELSVVPKSLRLFVPEQK